MPGPTLPEPSMPNLEHTCTVVHELKHPSQQKHTIQLIRESALFVCFYDGPNLPFGIEFFSDSDKYSLRRGTDECTLKKNKQQQIYKFKFSYFAILTESQISTSTSILSATTIYSQVQLSRQH